LGAKLKSLVRDGDSLSEDCPLWLYQREDDALFSIQRQGHRVLVLHGFPSLLLLREVQTQVWQYWKIDGKPPLPPPQSAACRSAPPSLPVENFDVQKSATSHSRGKIH
jgi:hypothetical protein